MLPRTRSAGEAVTGKVTTRPQTTGIELAPHLNNGGLLFDDRDRQTEYQGVKRCQKIPKLFRSFDRPIQIGVSLQLLATAGVASTEAKPVEEIVSSHNNHLN